MQMFHNSYYGPSVCTSPWFLCQILPYPPHPAKVLVLGGGAFEKCLGLEGGGLVNGVSAFISQTPERSLVRFAKWGHSKKLSSMKQKVSSLQRVYLAEPGPCTSQPPELWKRYVCADKSQCWAFCYSSPNQAGHQQPPKSATPVSLVAQHYLSYFPTIPSHLEFTRWNCLYLVPSCAAAPLQATTILSNYLSVYPLSL